MYASRTVLYRLGRRIERNIYGYDAFSIISLDSKVYPMLIRRNTGPWIILFTEITAEL